MQNDPEDETKCDAHQNPTGGSPRQARERSEGLGAQSLWDIAKGHS